MVALLVVGCTSADRPRVQGEEVDLPEPVQTFDASLLATVEALVDAVEEAGVRLDVPQQPYRPSEPQGLVQRPRAVLRAALADPDDGYVVIYEAEEDTSPSALAEELAAYLGSGFGRTNYPSDARFSVATVADTVVFTWWSPSRADDPERAEAVFEAISSVGESVAVPR